MQIFTHEEKPVLSDAFEPCGDFVFANSPQFEMPFATDGKSEQLSLFAAGWLGNGMTCEDVVEDEYER